MAGGLDGQTALLTGAAGGIGRAIARALHGRGATMLLSGRNVEGLEALATELGDRTEVVPADLAEPDDVSRLLARAPELDLLVANAGLPSSGLLQDFSAREIDRSLDVNLRAPMQLARAAVPGMVARGKGHIVLISSSSGKFTTAGQSVYSATKFGLRGFGFALHQELLGTGVGVTTVFPGFIRDAGMWADTGLDVPRGTGTSTPEDVAAGVLRGIDRNRAEVDVAPLAVRASLRLNGVAPGFVAAVARRMGANETSAAAAERQRDKR